MNDKIQVYHYIPGFNFGGIESRFIELYDYIDKNMFQYNLITYNNSNTSLISDVLGRHGKIYMVEPAFGVGFYEHRAKLKKIFSENKVDIAYCYTPESGFQFLHYAKKYGVKSRIMHARTSSFAGDSHKTLRKVFKTLSVKYANINIAVSHKAGDWMFGKKEYNVIPNAICIDKYSFSQEDRVYTRRQYSLGDGLLVGHVGRNTFAKNHAYLLSIFSEVKKRVSDAKLMLVGISDDETNIVDLCRQNGVYDSVIFCGYQKNLAPFYSAMDILAFPSLYEGFPGTIIEAQANGLRCLISDAITGEVALTPDVEYLSIREKPSIWADRIIKRSTYARQDNRRFIINAGYSLEETARRLMSIYTTGKC